MCEKERDECSWNFKQQMKDQNEGRENKGYYKDF
jgi:hypothetical protein